MMINMAAGFISPVFAIFILKQIESGSAQIAGTAAAVYWIIKSLLRMPIAYHLDKKRGEKDDFYSMILGFFIFGISHLLYIFARTPLHIYLIGAFMGTGGALAFTPWYGFFTRYIDGFQESFDWSFNLSLVGLGVALAGFLGGVIADKFGFPILFIMASLLSFLGILFLSLVYKQIKHQPAPKDKI